MNANEFAARVHADGKKVRRFLREMATEETRPKSGQRWNLPDKPQEVAKLKRRYSRWALTHQRATRVHN